MEQLEQLSSIISLICSNCSKIYMEQIEVFGWYGNPLQEWLQEWFLIKIQNLNEYISRAGSSALENENLKTFIDAEKLNEKLKTIVQYEMVWRVYKPENCNCVRIDDNDRPHINYEELNKYLILKYLPLTIGRDKLTTWIWMGRKYKPNTGEIEREIKKHMKDHFTEKQIKIHTNEVIFRLQIDTRVIHDGFDFNKNIKKFIPVANGVVDMETMDLLPHSFIFFFNFFLPVHYNPTAQCPTIDRFITDIVAEENRTLLYEIPARCLIGWTNEAFMLLGSGNNGKSTYLKLLETFLGEENVSNVPLQKICDERFATAELYGKLANICADIPKKPLKYTGYFKMLTGGDKIFADRKFRDPFKFENKAVLIFSANELPEVTDTTYAFWRRWIVIEFPNVFPENRDFIKNLITEEELSGFLNRVLAMCKRLLSGNVQKSKRVEDIMRLWMAQANSVWAFVNSCIEQDPKGEVVADELYRRYVSFCEANDLKAVNKTAFSLELQRLIRTTKKRERVSGELKYVWYLIRLKCSECQDKCVDGREGEAEDSELATELATEFDLSELLK